MELLSLMTDLMPQSHRSLITAQNVDLGYMTLRRCGQLQTVTPSAPPMAVNQLSSLTSTTLPSRTEHAKPSSSSISQSHVSRHPVVVVIARHVHGPPSGGTHADIICSGEVFLLRVY